MQQALREVLEECTHSEQLPQLGKLPQVCSPKPTPNVMQSSHAMTQMSGCMPVLQ